jgi:hypothetical protein
MTDFQITILVIITGVLIVPWTASCAWGHVTFRRYLQCLWVLPIAIPIYVCYLWPFELLGWLKRIGYDLDLVVYSAKTSRWPWYVRRFCPGWVGQALPGAIILSMDLGYMRKHEEEHVEQWYRWGVLFPIVYGLYRLRYRHFKNPFEVAARKAERRR